MHKEVSQFISYLKDKNPSYFEGTKVLEVGSMNINGGIRHLFKDCNYLGIDLGQGPDVDLEVPIHEFNRPNYYDVVVSTEMLEHDQYWKESLRQMYENLKPGGLLMITCAGPNRAEHGTKRTTPHDSPFTTDYYRNISLDDITEVLPQHLFSESAGSLIRGDMDTQFYGFKANTPIMPLSPLRRGTDEIIFVTAQPDDRFFVWEVEVQINNLRRYDLSHLYKCLVYWETKPGKTVINQDWLDLKEKYPEVEFFFFRENEKELPAAWVKNIYSSIIRPYILSKFFKAHPEHDNKSVFYMDSDVIFLGRPEIEKYMAGDEVYVTNTDHYLNIDYLQRKAMEANLPKDHFVDILVDITGIDRQKYIAADRVASGGAQYVLKPMLDGYAVFWEKVLRDTLQIKQTFARENQTHYQELGRLRPDGSAENAGVQSWCADMWGVLLNLIIFGKRVTSPSFMQCPWSSDATRRLTHGDLKDSMMIHNTGIGGNISHHGKDIPFASVAFDKTRYRWGRSLVDHWPYEENFNYISPDYLSWYYVQEIKNTYKME